MTDSLVQVTSTGVPGGQSLLVTRSLYLQKSQVVLRVGQRPALPASLRCREQVFLEVTFHGLPGGQRLLITCDRVCMISHVLGPGGQVPPGSVETLNQRAPLHLSNSTRHAVLATTSFVPVLLVCWASIRVDVTTP